MKKKIPNNFIIDIDGIMTNGNMIYSYKKKEFKIFGPDDNDALKVLSNYINIIFITADKRGFAISQKRIEHDMKMKLFLVDGKKRKNTIFI